MGPLDTIRVVEIAGIGPAPVCGMILADLGADVVTVERKRQRSGPMDVSGVVWNRGKQSLAIDLKQPGAREVVLTLCETRDVLIEGFRPGVMERLGLGPDEVNARNPTLVYGRLSGWGQHGPMSRRAGHDLNFTSLAGALHASGRADSPPIVPPTMVGDLGGGSMLLAVGLLAAVLKSRETGQGQVVDAAVSDGAALMTTLLWELAAAGRWSDRRQANLFDGGAHWYDSYECADGKYVSIGALEPAFYGQLLDVLGLADDPLFSDQYEPSKWPQQKHRLASLLCTRTRDEWCALFDGVDACVTPVLTLAEAPQHPHNVARATFCEIDGVPQPSPAPRFSATPATLRGGAPGRGDDTERVLAAAGFSAEEIIELKAAGAI